MTSAHIAHDMDMRNLQIIPEVGLTEIDGEPRARDIEIAERLGYSRPRAVRDLIKKNLAEIEAFGAVRHGANIAVSGKGKETEVEEFWLTEEQALAVATLSKAPNAAAVRAMLIRTFVAWRRGHLASAAGEIGVLSPEACKVIGGIVKKVVHAQLAEVTPAIVAQFLPTAVAGYIADHNLALADGLTAGEVCDLAKVATSYPRGVSGRVSARLTKFCQRNGERPRISRLGRVRAQIFPTHLVRDWLDVEGRVLIRRWIDEKKGQGALKLVPKA